MTAAKTFLNKETRLDGLINNAGIMMTPLHVTTDGYEDQWQTNYLAHWVFTSHLLPLLLETSKGLPEGSVRIVNLTSSGHVGLVVLCTMLSELIIASGLHLKVESTSMTQHSSTSKITAT